MFDLPLLKRLQSARRILLAGAGGGFDIYSGIPLYLMLRGAGKEVYLGNLAFTELAATDATRLHEACYRVEPGPGWTELYSYYPEKHLCNWLAERGDQTSVYAFPRTGVRPLTSAYEFLARELQLDAIVLVDGGTDSLMGGDEAGLGTPGEDSSSLIAVSRQPDIDKLLVCLGFGVDDFHGVCHYQFLENVARLSQRGAFLGSLSLLPQMPEALALVEAVAYANEKMRSFPSIVGNSIADALQGHYGDHHATRRTQGTELWINPLMAFYWGFDLAEVVHDLLYSELLLDTETFGDIMLRIEKFRETIPHRPRRPLPL